MGSFAANAFGLFDMHGNLAEMCLDAFGGYFYPTAPGTGEREVQGVSHRVMRSGGWMLPHSAARSSARWPVELEDGGGVAGARAARAVMHH